MEKSLVEGNVSEGGLPDGLVEVSVELPEDGLNGECVVHYDGDNSKYELMVTLVNGVREGMAILFCDGVPSKMCEYRNGAFTGHVEEVTEWKLILSKTVNSKESILYYNIETEHTHGVVKGNEWFYAVDGWRGTYRMIVANVNRKKMAMYENNKRMDPVCANEVIDLDANGRRWEGGVRNEKPFGYGVLYDEEGRKEYEGIMVDGVKVCYGKEYYSDIEKVRYEGCYYEGKHFGKGVLYDRNGMVEYGGLWEHDKPYSDQHDNNTIDCTTESVDISDNSFNEVIAFILPFFLCSLKRIVIGDNCFGKVRVVELDGLGELESVVIGQDSFTNTKYADYVWNEIPAEGSFRIQNCPKLKSIQIGDWSFADYHMLSLTGLIE